MNRLSTEAIAHQSRNHPFIVEMKHLSNLLISSKDDKKEAEKALHKIALLIYETMGISTRFNIVDSKTINAYASFNEGSLTDSLLNVNIKSALKDFNIAKIEPVDILKGSIDYDTCKVTGWLCDIPFGVVLTTALLDIASKQPDCDELLTAVIMHEIGHIWTAMVGIGMYVVTACITTGIADFFDRDQGSDKDAQYVKLVVDKYKGKAIDSKDPAATCIDVVMTRLSVIKGAEKLTPIKFKFVETHERLADQFAARWGMGISEMKFLKLVGERGGMAKKAVTSWLLFSRAIVIFSKHLDPILDAGTVTKSVGVFGKHMVKSLVSLKIAFFFVTLFTTPVINHFSKGKHPTLTERIDIVRRETIALLRITDDPVERLRIMDELAQIDELDVRKSNWFGKIYNLDITIANYLVGDTRNRNAVNSLTRRENNILHELTARLEAI